MMISLAGPQALNPEAFMWRAHQDVGFLGLASRNLSVHLCASLCVCVCVSFSLVCVF